MRVHINETIVAVMSEQPLRVGDERKMSRKLGYDTKEGNLKDLFVFPAEMI